MLDSLDMEISSKEEETKAPHHCCLTGCPILWSLVWIETEIKVKAEASHIRIKTELSGGIRVTSDPPEPALKNLSFLQTSLLVQWLRLFAVLVMQEAQVQSLVGKLRSHMT